MAASFSPEGRQRYGARAEYALGCSQQARVARADQRQVAGNGENSALIGGKGEGCQPGGGG